MCIIKCSYLVVEVRQEALEGSHLSIRNLYSHKDAEFPSNKILKMTLNDSPAIMSSPFRT